MRALLSFFILFQLTVAIVAPNPDGFISKKIAAIIGPYAEFFEFGASWSFFAPDPGPPMVVIEWELMKAGVAFELGRLPEFPKKYFFQDRFNKRISFSRFITQSDKSLDEVMTAWLCRTHPEAESIKLYLLIHQLPKYRDIQEGRVKLEESLKPIRRFVLHSICARPVGGEL